MYQIIFRSITKEDKDTKYEFGANVMASYHLPGKFRVCNQRITTGCVTEIKSVNTQLNKGEAYHKTLMPSN